jgi:hypothetical protein
MRRFAASVTGMSASETNVQATLARQVVLVPPDPLSPWHSLPSLPPPFRSPRIVLLISLTGYE